MSLSNRREQHESKDPPADLPVEITAVRIQKKRPDRVSLFHEEQFLIGLSEAVRQSFGIQTGMDLTHSLWHRLQEEEQRRGIRDRLIRLLGRRNHTRSELFRKLQSKGEETDLIDEELDRLEEEGYLDPAAFARQFAHDKLHLRGWGPRKIRGELRRRGVNEARADEAIREESETLDLSRICVDLAMKRRRHFLREEDSFRRRQKIAAWLQRKGYTRESILAAMPEILEHLDDATSDS